MDLTDAGTGTIESYGADPAPPSEAVRALDRLVGTWDVVGGAEGLVRYEWLPGGFFLVQHVELSQGGQQVRGFEVIGQLRPFGEPPSRDVHSRFYDSDGNTFDYVYELDGEALTIWAGAKGSPAFFRGSLSTDGRTIEGEWVYPGGGGYASTMRRR